jgi:hypothetical protein
MLKLVGKEFIFLDFFWGRRSFSALILILSERISYTGGAAISGNGWDVIMPDALDYIANSSYFSNSLSEDNKYRRSISAIRESARSGRIRVAGCEPGTSILSPIPIGVWKYAKFIADKSSETVLKLVTQSDVVLYTDMFVDKTELEKVWPKKPVDWRRRV